MARIAGVDLPPNKRVEIALTYIYGIGRTQSNRILGAAAVNLDTKVRDLNDDEINKIRKVIEEQHQVEGDLRYEIRNICLSPRKKAPRRRKNGSCQPAWRTFRPPSTTRP